MIRLSTSILSCIGLVLLLSLCNVGYVLAEKLIYNAHYDNVLGTSLDVDIYGIKEVQANVALSKTLEEIQRLENILSTWKNTSQITQLNSVGKDDDIADELIKVVSLCEKWRALSHRKFSCRMGKIRQLWLDAERNQQVPDRIKVRYQARDIERANLTVDLRNNHVEFDKTISLDLAGLAKGFIIDQATSYLRQLLPTATGIKLDIGGDAFYWGKPNGEEHWKVLVAEPHFLTDSVDAANETSLNNDQMIINLQSMAIASSGHTSRFREIERRRFSHIINPQDGWPMNDAPAATVIAADAITADAVATALSSQTAAQGIDWVNQLDNVEALIMLPDGLKLASKGWTAYLASKAVYQAKQLSNNRPISPLNHSKEDTEKVVQAEQIEGKDVNLNTKIGSKGILIKYQIPDLEESTKYHKPYVAIWVSNRKNKSVRNLLLLGESNRWAKENTRWWRRVGRKNRTLIDGIARPTRRPGLYELYWDGLDDFGNVDQASQYYLNVEASREGGGHDYQKVSFEFGDSVNTKNISQPISLDAKGEVGKVTLIYTPQELQLASKQASHQLTTSHQELDDQKLGVRELDIQELNIQESNIQESNIQESNIQESNIEVPPSSTSRNLANNHQD
ncbi:MAG: DUF2271 domain-containing protein [Kangiellaceae bacterium]|nr:DUF2271 domain-containing protein [Kangiellaceae bacterium]